MVMEQRNTGSTLQEPPHDRQAVSAAGPTLLRHLLRLTTGPSEVASVLRFFFKYLKWRLTGSSNADRDETLRLQRVTHVLGLGTFELFALLEIYGQRDYDRLPDFVPQRGWTVFDVGANAGVYAVQQARRGAHVYAFEPNPDCYRRLRKSVRANNLESRVMAFNYALGATAGSAELFVPSGSTTGGSLRPDLWTPGAGDIGLKVEVETIDRVVRRLGINRIDLLKVDVEGLELDVLRGAHESFEPVNHLVVEYHTLDLGRRVVKLLSGRGMSIVLDQRNEWLVSNGLLFARRQAGLVPGRSAPGIAMA